MNTEHTDSKLTDTGFTPAALTSAEAPDSETTARELAGSETTDTDAFSEDLHPDHAAAHRAAGRGVAATLSAPAAAFHTQTPAVEAIGLTRLFGEKRAVDGIDLVVQPGEFFGFLGPNGAGKSTTIKMLVGLLRPSAGTARIAGIDLWQNPIDAKQLLGVLPEGLNLYERLTGREYIRFAGAMYGVSDLETERRTDELLDLMDLTADADKLIIDYSHGMRKKTALAAAMIHAPRVLFLDEPFEGIDAISSRAIREVLLQLVRRGTTIFFSSHILEVVERLCTRLAVIANGRLVAEGTIPELRAQAGASSTLEEIFLQAVADKDQEAAAPRERTLSWLTESQE